MRSGHLESLVGCSFDPHGVQVLVVELLQALFFFFFFFFCNPILRAKIYSMLHVLSDVMYLRPNRLVAPCRKELDAA